MKNQIKFYRNVFLICTFQFLILQNVCGQETNPKAGNAIHFQMRRHYFSFGLDASTIVNLKAGFSFGYIHGIDKKSRHYLGLQLTGFPSKQTNPINVNYGNLQTRNGEAETNLSIIALEIVHYYFFTPTQQYSPFICAGVGGKSVSNDLNTSFDYYSGFPFGWLHNGGDASLSSTIFSAKLEAGYWYNWTQNRGLYAKVGVNFAESFKIINGSSAIYNGDSWQYTTSNSNPVSVTFGIGMLF